MCYRRYLGILTNDLNFVAFSKKYKSLFYFSENPFGWQVLFSHSEPFSAFILLRGGLDWKIITQWVKFSPWLLLCKPGVKSWKQGENFSAFPSIFTELEDSFGQNQNLSWHFAWNLVYPGFYRTPFFFVDLGIIFFLPETRVLLIVWNQDFFRYEPENNKVACVGLLTHSHAILDLLDIWIAWVLFGGQRRHKWVSDGLLLSLADYH